MNSSQETLARLDAKKAIQEAQKNQEKQEQKVTSIFRENNCKNFFETTPTVVKNHHSFTSANVDFVYYKLNIEYLQSLGISLESVKSDISVSSNSTEIASAEYYAAKEHSCIIFVIYRFKHVRLQSENGKTDLNTFVFVNSDCEVYYYDEYSGVKLLTSFATGMNTDDAQEIFAEKQFPLSPISSNRTYQITSDENPDMLMEEKLVNLDLIPKKLLDIFFKNYEGKNTPTASEIEIECRLISTTEKPVTIQTSVPASYRYTGTVELSEKMEAYEIIMYFPSNLSQKLRARFSLTESEKNGYLILTKELLKQAVLVPATQKDFKNRDFFENADYSYDEHLISYAPRKKTNSAVQSNIADLIRKHITVEHNVLKVPQLKDTFQKVYIEHANIHVNDISSEHSLKQLTPTTIQYEDDSLCQNSYYSIVYNGILYLAKVSFKYTAFAYRDFEFIIHIPALAICSDTITVFKPSKPEEVDSFSDGILKRQGCDFHYTWKLKEYENNRYYTSSLEAKFNKIFSDFAITSPESVSRTNYRTVEKNNDTIYKGILNCIQNPEKATAIFRYSYPIHFGGPSDEDPPKKRTSIFTGDIEYGFYFEDECERKVVNSSFRPSDPNTCSNRDDLLTVQIDGEERFFSTTFYTLLDKLYRKAHIVTVRDQFKYSDLWNLCVEFLFEKQSEILSD